MPSFSHQGNKYKEQSAPCMPVGTLRLVDWVSPKVLHWSSNHLECDCSCRQDLFKRLLRAVLVRVSLAVMKHHDQETRWGGKVWWPTKDSVSIWSLFCLWILWVQVCLFQSPSGLGESSGWAHWGGGNTLSIKTQVGVCQPKAHIDRKGKCLLLAGLTR